LQVFDLSSDSAFSSSLGSPPQAAYITVVGRFLVLSGLLSTPYRIQWSGLNSFNAAASWTSGTNSSDFQDFPDGGIVRGVAGGEFGTIFQDQAIRRMSYIPGSTLIFQIERVTQDMGLCRALFDHSRRFDHLFLRRPRLSQDRPDRRSRADRARAGGPHLSGGFGQAICNCSWGRPTRAPREFIGPINRCRNATGLYDKILGYDSALDRFFQISMSGEFFFGVSQPGLTLENLDAISASIDALDGFAWIRLLRRFSR
jgi:hypothetical protein